MAPTPDQNPFASTEKYYARHRPGYGEEPIRYLRDRFGVDGDARVLDLGCGPGQVAVPLAAHAGEVVGMDPNEEMLRRADRRARAAGRENVEWVVGSDADLTEDLGTFRLATMGRSFHWTDQVATLSRLHRMTEAGGGVAILTDREWLTRGTRAWQAAAYATVGEYVDDLPPRTGPVEYDEDPWDERLAEHFGDVEIATFESEREWDVDGVVGYVFSLSFCSPEILEDDAEAFEEALRARLNARNEEKFVEEVAIEVISGRK